MSEDVLVYKPIGREDFTKQSSYDIEISRSVSEWPMEVIRHFAQAHPYAYMEQAANVEFQKVDDKEGNAFGAIIISAPLQTQGFESRERLQQEPVKVAVPVIIEKFHLKPFDVFVKDDRVFPMTEKRFMEAIASNQIASGLDPYSQPSPAFIDKMMPPTVAYLGNLYGSGMSGGSGDYTSHPFGKSSSDKTAGSANSQHDSSIVHEIKGTIQKADYEDFKRCCNDGRVLNSFASNKNLGIIKELMGTVPTSGDDYVDFIERAAPVHVIRVQGLSNGRYRTTEWSDYFFKPVTREMAVDELVARYSSIEPNIAVLAHTADGILIEAPDRSTIKPILLEDLSVTGTEEAVDGHYLVATKGGGFIEGQVFSNVVDYNKNALSIKLFTSGTAYGMCDSVVGHRMGGIFPGLRSGSVEIGVEGTFVGVEEDGKGGDYGFVLMPFKVTNVAKMCGYYVIQGLGQGLEHLTFVVMQGISRYNSLTGVADPGLGTHVGGNIYYVPATFKFVSVGKKVDLESSPAEINRFTQRKALSSIHGSSFYLDGDHRGLDRTIRITCDKDGVSVHMTGRILDTIRRDNYLYSVPHVEAAAILAQLGCSLDDATHILDRAHEEGEVSVTNLRPAKDIVDKSQIYDTKIVEIARMLRKNLVKEASSMADPESVDAMLSLGFVNETNLGNFLKNLPKFQDIESKLAELLLYTRIGLKNRIPEEAVYSAMANLNEVNENLEYLDSLIRQSQMSSRGAPSSAQVHQPAKK